MSEPEQILLEDQKSILNIPYYLAKSEEGDELYQILTDFDFVSYKISATPLQLLVEDYSISVQLESIFSAKQIKILRIFQRVIQQSSRIIQKDTNQLVEQLFGRLCLEESLDIRDFLRNAQNSKINSWLRPIQPSLTLSQDQQGTLIQILEGHTQMITDCALSEDGKIGLTASRDCTLRIWNLERGNCEHILIEHNSQVNACSLSSDGKIALSASSDKTLRLWDTATGNCLHILKGHTDKVTDCALSNDSRIALSTSKDHTAKVWDVKTGECIRTFDKHTDSVTCCDLSSDGKKALSGSYDQTLQLWSTETGECFSVIENDIGAFICCTLAEDKNLALSISDVMIIEDDTNNSGEIVISPFPGRDNDSSPSEFADFNDLSDEQSKDWSQYIAYMVEASGLSMDMLKENSLVRLWDLEKGQCIAIFEEDTSATKCELDKEGKIALSSTVSGGDIHIWNVETGQCLSSLSTSSTFVSALAINERGTFAFAASDNGDIRLWNLEKAINNNNSPEKQSNKGEFISGCGYSQDGNQAFSMSRNGTIENWDTETGSSINKTNIGISLCFKCVVSSQLEVGLINMVDDMRHNLYLIDLKTAKCLFVLNQHSSVISNFAMSDNGKVIISASESELHWGGFRENKEYLYIILEEFSEVAERVISCCLNQDGTILATAYSNGIIRIRRLEETFLLDIETGHEDLIVKCVLSSSGSIVISSSKDGTFKVWNAITGKCIYTLPIETDLYHFSISSDEKFVLYCQARDTVQVLDLDNGQVFGRFTFDSWVSALAFSPGNRQVMIGDYSGYIHFLQLENPTLKSNSLAEQVDK
jgi:WD40 repeat protein